MSWERAGDEKSLGSCCGQVNNNCSRRNPWDWLDGNSASLLSEIELVVLVTDERGVDGWKMLRSEVIEGHDSLKSKTLSCGNWSGLIGVETLISTLL